MVLVDHSQIILYKKLKAIIEDLETSYKNTEISKTKAVAYTETRVDEIFTFILPY